MTDQREELYVDHAKKAEAHEADALTEVDKTKDEILGAQDHEKSARQAAKDSNESNAATEWNAAAQSRTNAANAYGAAAEDYAEAAYQHSLAADRETDKAKDAEEQAEARDLDLAAQNWTRTADERRFAAEDLDKAGKKDDAQARRTAAGKADENAEAACEKTGDRLAYIGRKFQRREEDDKAGDFFAAAAREYEAAADINSKAAERGEARAAIDQAIRLHRAADRSYTRSGSHEGEKQATVERAAVERLTKELQSVK